MRPPARAKTDFEQVKVDEWIVGEIEDIAYDMEYKSTYKGEEKIGPAIRFKFKLEKYQYPHYSRWLSFSYGEKSNLYKKFITPLVEGAVPDMDFDLDALKGLPIKIMYSQNGDFQNVEMIRPLKTKVSRSAEAPEPVHEDAPPF